MLETLKIGGVHLARWLGTNIVPYCITYLPCQMTYSRDKIAHLPFPRASEKCQHDTLNRDSSDSVSPNGMAYSLALMAEE